MSMTYAVGDLLANITLASRDGDAKAAAAGTHTCSNISDAFRQFSSHNAAKHCRTT